MGGKVSRAPPPEPAVPLPGTSDNVSKASDLARNILSATMELEAQQQGWSGSIYKKQTPVPPMSGGIRATVQAN